MQNGSAHEKPRIAARSDALLLVAWPATDPVTDRLSRVRHTLGRWSTTAQKSAGRMHRVPASKRPFIILWGDICGGATGIDIVSEASVCLCLESYHIFRTISPPPRYTLCPAQNIVSPVAPNFPRCVDTATDLCQTREKRERERNTACVLPNRFRHRRKFKQ